MTIAESIWEPMRQAGIKLLGGGESRAVRRRTALLPPT